MPKRFQRVSVQPLRRVVVRLEERDYQWIVTAAANQGWSISRFLASIVIDARAAEEYFIRVEHAYE